jgi:hypothetical protein
VWGESLRSTRVKYRTDHMGGIVKHSCLTLGIYDSRFVMLLWSSSCPQYADRRVDVQVCIHLARGHRAFFHESPRQDRTQFLRVVKFHEKLPHFWAGKFFPCARLCTSPEPDDWVDHFPANGKLTMESTELETLLGPMAERGVEGCLFHDNHFWNATATPRSTGSYSRKNKVCLAAQDHRRHVGLFSP